MEKCYRSGEGRRTTSLHYSEKIMDMADMNLTGTETDYSLPIFGSAYFMMYVYKVMPCQKTYRHDWRVCPYAHMGETAARRHPKRHLYVGVICPETKKGEKCPRGDCCPCTHSLFEYWLHPTRFKTEFCSRGSSCSRAFCFFAHSEAELRVFDTSVLSSPMARKALSIAEGSDCKRFRTSYPDRSDATLINHPFSALDVGLTGQSIWSVGPNDLESTNSYCGMSALSAALTATSSSSPWLHIAPATPMAQHATLWDRSSSSALFESGHSTPISPTTLDSIQSKFSHCCSNNGRQQQEQQWVHSNDLLSIETLAALIRLFPPLER